MIHERRLFCFTGKFVHGTRSECQDEAIARSAGVHGAPGRETDYLVIGSIGSRNWIHSSFGRKIEKAVQLREDGVRLAIVSEGHWVASLRS